MVFFGFLNLRREYGLELFRKVYFRICLEFILLGFKLVFVGGGKGSGGYFG